MKRREQFADQEPNEDWVPEIFKTTKVGKHLRNFLTGFKSELTGTTFNKVRSNIVHHIQTIFIKSGKKVLY